MTTAVGIANGFQALRRAGATLPAAMEANLDASVAVWVLLTADLTDAQFFAGCLVWPRERKATEWWPTVGQILALVPDRPGARPPPNGDLAWGYLLERVRRYGRGRPPTTGLPADALPPSALPAPRVVPAEPPHESRAAWLARKQAAIANGDYLRTARPSPPPPWRLADDADERAALELGLGVVGGWEALCNLPTEQSGPTRASFRSAYEAALGQRYLRAQANLSRALLETPRAKRLIQGDL